MNKTHHKLAYCGSVRLMEVLDQVLMDSEKLAVFTEVYSVLLATIQTYDDQLTLNRKLVLWVGDN